MTTCNTMTCVIFSLTTSLSLLATESAAVTIDHFSSSTVLTYGSNVDIVNEIFVNENPLYLQKNASTTGGTASGSLSYLGTEGTASAQAESSLATGTLKAKAQSTSLVNTGPFDNNAFGFARADVGDSFQTFDNQGPLQWTNATDVTFSIDLSGFVSTGSGVNSRADAGFFLGVFKPGFLDAYAQWLINGASFPSEYNDNLLFGFDYSLGGEVQSFQQPFAVPGVLDITFAPGGDFDWVAGIFMDTAASLTDTSIADFFSTATMSYTGPAGTTTYSASGLFPGTQPLSSAPVVVSEPGILALMGIALAGIRLRRMKDQHRKSA